MKFSTSMARARAELLRLRALEQDVRWGKIEMEPDKAERPRQYLAGRSEISVGDEPVPRHLRGNSRERQRLALGLPLLIIGFAGFFAVRQGSGMTCATIWDLNNGARAALRNRALGNASRELSEAVECHHPTPQEA